MDMAAAKKLNENPHKLYFKSLLYVERWFTSTRFEVIICDQEDNLVFKSNGPLHYYNMPSMEADIRALMRGLDEATLFGINHISIYCPPRHLIFEYLLGISYPKEKEIALLMDDVKRIRNRFRSSKIVMMFEEDVKFVSRLSIETCIICLENIRPELMFSGCEKGHRICLTCAKSHIKVKLLDGMIPNCPQLGCKSQLSIVRCGVILTENLCLMWKQRIKEDSIPYSQRFYCPYQSCSYLMSKTDISSSSAEKSGLRRCFKCGGSFCIHCKVPWHTSLSCTKYKRLHTQNDDAKLKSLANANRWRQCSNCQHMIERSSGCDHMFCRYLSRRSSL
ncbi:unnamed protein product [Arabidopsis halleri]